MHFCFGLQQERLCKTDLSGLKLSVNIANPRSKLLCTEVKGLYQVVRKQTLYVYVAGEKGGPIFGQLVMHIVWERAINTFSIN